MKYPLSEQSSFFGSTASTNQLLSVEGGEKKNPSKLKLAKSTSKSNLIQALPRVNETAVYSINRLEGKNTSFKVYCGIIARNEA